VPSMLAEDGDAHTKYALSHQFPPQHRTGDGSGDYFPKGCVENRIITP